MSTERSSFGLNSIIPSTYRTKAEAFAKCLQDKLRSLSGVEDSPETLNGESQSEPGVLNKYSEEEIADNVFLQGPLSYKRRSVPENGTEKPYTNGRSGKFIGSLVDKRGMSSDSEDSDEESKYKEPSVHPRVAELQINAARRLVSTNSNDSTSSFFSCDGGEADLDEDEDIADSFASQIRGSPTIHNPRLKSYKRRGREDKSTKKDHPPPAPPSIDSDLFFDFDVECFSPVNDGEDGEEPNDLDQSQLRLQEDHCSDADEKAEDTGQLAEAAAFEEDGANFFVKEEPSVNEKGFVLCCDESDDKNEQPTDSGIASLRNENDLLGRPSDAELEEAPRSNDANSVTCHEVNSQHDDDVRTDCDTEHETDRNCSAEDKSETEANEKELLINWQRLDLASYENENNVNIESYENDTEVEGVNHETENSNNLEGNDLEHIPHIEEAPTEVRDLNGQAETLVEDSRFNVTPTEEFPCFQLTVEEAVEATPISVAKIEEDTDIDPSYLPSPRMKLRRCSSLKTWKTPPGTPGSKKIVRFADALGLDLADVRTFLDEIPKIPNSAYDDLHYDLPPLPPPAPAERTLIPMFQQPGMLPDFLTRVRQNNVSLESAVLTDIALLAISGIVRVRNLSFHKSVHVRYSKDSWKSFADLQATYVPNSSDGSCDNFSFTLYCHTLSLGDKIEFAIRYDCEAGQFWDSNLGSNYVFHCMPRSPIPVFPPLGSSPVDTWEKFY